MEVFSNTTAGQVGDKRVEGSALVAAAASLPITLRNSAKASVIFAVDAEAAEKGIVGNLPEVQMPSTPRVSFSTQTTIESEQGAAADGQTCAGANRYSKIHEAVEGVIKESNSDEDISEQNLIIVQNSLTSSADEGIPVAVGQEVDRSSEMNVEMKAKDTGFDRIVERDYKTYPLGWPRLAAFLNSADNYAIFRRFGTAHCRILLHLMAEITSIEKELDALDESDSKDESMLYRLRRNEWEDGWDTAQKDLLEKLREKLLQYDEILIKDLKLRELDSPPQRDFRHVFRWIYYCKPLDQDVYDFILHRDDFVSSDSGPRNPFDGLIESLLSWWPQSLFQVLMRDKTQVRHRDSEMKNAGDTEVHFYERSRILLVGKLIAVCIAVTLLLIPVFLLYLTQMSRIEVSGMVLAFVFIFAMLISLFTGAKVELVFVGTCTYCAVLVTFMGSVQDA